MAKKPQTVKKKMTLRARLRVTALEKLDKLATAGGVALQAAIEEADAPITVKDLARILSTEDNKTLKHALGTVLTDKAEQDLEAFYIAQQGKLELGGDDG